MLNLKGAAFLVPSFGLIIAMVEEWWWYKELLPLIWALVRRKAFNKETSTRLIKQKGMHL